MADESIVEYVTLRAAGIADVEKQIEKLEKATQRATNQSLALAKSYLDPKYVESLKNQEKARQAAEHIVAAKRQQIRLEEQQHAAAARHAVAVARYGRTGAMVAGGLSRAAPYLGNAAMGVGLGITAGARAGFQGTVEGNRLHNEISQINRELAGAFLPVMKEVTAGMRGLRRVLQSLGPAGQNAVMFGGLAASGYGAYRAAGLASAMAAHATGNAAGSALGNAAGGAAGAKAASGGGLAMGALVAGGSLFSAIKNYDSLRAAGNTFSHARDVYRDPTAYGLSGFGSGAKYGAKLGASSALYTAGALPGMAFLKDFGDQINPQSSNKKRGQVTIADAGFEGIGSAYERVSNQAAMVGAQNAEDSTTLGDIFAWLQSQATRIF